MEIHGDIREPRRQDLWRDWEKIFTGVQNPRCETIAREFYATHRREMDEGVELLWPDREPLYDLMCLRATIGEAAFQAEKQGNPTSGHTSEWPAARFGPLIWFDQWPETRLRVIALDPSKGESETSDYSAFVLLGLGEDALMYVDADLARRDTTQIVCDGLEISDRFRPDGFVVETNQYQDLLKDEFARRSRERGLMLPLYGLVNTQNKRVRIRTLTPYFRDLQFRFKSASEGAALLVDQLREFPTARHDDGPEALEMAVRLMKHILADKPEDRLVSEIVTT